MGKDTVQKKKNEYESPKDISMGGGKAEWAVKRSCIRNDGVAPSSTLVEVSYGPSTNELERQTLLMSVPLKTLMTSECMGVWLGRRVVEN